MTPKGSNRLIDSRYNTHTPDGRWLLSAEHCTCILSAAIRSSFSLTSRDYYCVQGLCNLLHTCCLLLLLQLLVECCYWQASSGFPFWFRGCRCCKEENLCSSWSCHLSLLQYTVCTTRYYAVGGRYLACLKERVSRVETVEAFYHALLLLLLPTPSLDEEDRRPNNGPPPLVPFPFAENTHFFIRVKHWHWMQARGWRPEAKHS